MPAGPSTEAGSPRETGYLHADYAAALDALGTARQLPASRAWILERDIPNSTHHDAMGCYPLFCCGNWAGLEDDLRGLEANTDLVAFSAVVDPFCNLESEQLTRCFPDLLAPFKQHFIVDLQIPIDDVLDTHHRRNVRKGLGNLNVETVTTGEQCDDDFVALYAILTAKHKIRGWSAFSPVALRRQLRVPGMIAFRALQGRTTVGMAIWYVQGQSGYYHLAAYSDAGYEARASYAVFSVAIRHFATTGLRRLDLGAAAGLSDEETDGLARFKRGWSTGTKPAYLCGRVLDRKAYDAIASTSGNAGTSYFPAYRKGELA